MPAESVAGTFPFAAGTIPLCRTEITPEAQHAAVRVLASGWVTTGSESAEFEREFAAWVGAQYAVAVSSCTAAIQLALLGLDLPHGAPVLTPTLTLDRKSTRLNSSHGYISYAVFCLKKKNY